MKRLFAVLVWGLVLCFPAFALSDAEYFEMKKDPEFAAADRELARVYREARDSMPQSEFAKLKREQLEWVKHGRDEVADKYMQTTGYDEILAYTEATRIRIREIRNEMTLSSLSTDDVQGYYDRDGEVYLHVRWKNRREKLLEVSLSCPSERGDWKGTGHLRGNMIVANNGGTVATLTFIDNNTVEIEVNSMFRRAGFDADGTYNRHYGK